MCTAVKDGRVALSRDRLIHLRSGGPVNLQVLGAFHGAVSSYFLSQDFMGAFNASVNSGHGVI